jgi:hypothetical protein
VVVVVVEVDVVVVVVVVVIVVEVGIVVVIDEVSGVLPTVNPFTTLVKLSVTGLENAPRTSVMISEDAGVVASSLMVFEFSVVYPATGVVSSAAVS